MWWSANYEIYPILGQLAKIYLSAVCTNRICSQLEREFKSKQSCDGEMEPKGGNFWEAHLIGNDY